MGKQAFKRQAFKREYAQMELAFWWRRVRRKHLKRTVLRQLAVTTKAVNVVKASESKSGYHDDESVGYI